MLSQNGKQLLVLNSFKFKMHYEAKKSGSKRGYAQRKTAKPNWSLTTKIQFYKKKHN